MSARNYFLEVTGLLFWILVIPAIPSVVLFMIIEHDIVSTVVIYCMFLTMELMAYHMHQEWLPKYEA